MSGHTFGGDWTEKKLELLRKYLPAYTTVLEGNQRGRWFTRHYIDAFAGSGDREHQDPESGLTEIKEGSTKIALDTLPPFHRFLFIESGRQNVVALRDLADKCKPDGSIVEVKQGDANTELVSWCKSISNKDRAVVFIDPYGMQLEWRTLEALAETGAVDVWLLFPLGMGVNRLLTRRTLPPVEWQDKLTRVLGTDDWKEAFYRTDPQQNLFGDTNYIRDASIDAIGDYVLKRLSSIFTKVADNAYVLRNSNRNPMFLFCFAASNAKGAEVGMKIANDILMRSGNGR